MHGMYGCYGKGKGYIIYDSVLRQKAYTHRKLEKAKRQHKNITKHFDYTPFAGRLRTVSWSSDSQPTGGRTVRTLISASMLFLSDLCG